MNERIKDLAEEAIRLSVVHTEVYRPDGYLNGVSKEFADKFAELIIKECTNVVVDINQDYDGGSTTVNAAEEIKQHFGIE